MLVIAICDDERYYQQYLRKLVKIYMKNHDLEYKVDIYESGEKFVELGIEMDMYDIIFLDINMIEMNGIETVRMIRKVSLDINVVFVTAYISYAIEGYKYDVARYLVKGNDNFQQLLEECLDAVLEKMHFKIEQRQYNFIEGRKMVNIEKIQHIESNLHKLQFWIMEQKLTVYSLYEKLNKIDEQLEPFGFIRIHQSYLVNVRQIKSIKNYKVILISGREFPISKSKFKNAKEAFVAYKGDI